MTSSPEVDYECSMPASYEEGRDLSPEADEAWRRAVGPVVADAHHVIDVGAGTGRYARRLAEIVAGDVIAVEPATGMRRRGRSLTPASVRWVAGRAEHLPVRTGGVDAALAAFVVHYLDLPAAGRELARVVAPGGRVLIWSVFPDRFDDLAWLRWFPAARAIDEQRMPSVADVTRAFAPHGLHLHRRSLHPTLVAHDLGALADRLAYRSISTLTLISDADFSAGIDAIRNAAIDAPSAPVMSPHELLEFRRSETA